MKKLLYISIVAAASMAMTGCIEEVNPQSNVVTSDQAGNAPGSFNNFVDALTSSITGVATYTGGVNYSPSLTDYPFDYGYCSTFLMWDVMGQDIALTNSGYPYSAWAYCSVGLGPRYAIAQIPITYYYGWIKNCNTVLGMVDENNVPENRRVGVGIAYVMRAMFYMDLARLYGETTYALDPQAPTAPIVTEKTTPTAGTVNPRATNEEMFGFILDDLDKAETMLADYHRADIYTPDVSVVNGLRARAYLTMEDWPNAEKYAKLAQAGYSMMSESEYTDRNTGFNTPTSSWMFGTRFKADDQCIQENDADASWGSLLSLEIASQDLGGGGCGYASNYYGPMAIDYHLYQTIPSTDFRKKCFIDFSIADTYNPVKDSAPEPTQATVEFASRYSDYPEFLANNSIGNNETGYTLGGACIKFRAAGGEEGRKNQNVGFLMSVPYMRVEEMKLIEAEAAGMQSEPRGIQLLTDFAKTRDPQYVYGTHNEAYGNSSTTPFRNEVWWQRRVELWGEGFATYDIKRLNKGIIRSYEGTNHINLYQWNTDTPPQWMTLCFVGTEANYNTLLINNPTPVAPTGNSPMHVW